MITIQQKMRLLALICLVGSFQPTLVKADMREVAYTCLNQVLQNKVISGCFATILALFILYKAHIKHKVYRVEKILQLEGIQVQMSCGPMGPLLMNRSEAMLRVFSAIKLNLYLNLTPNETTELKALVTNQPAVVQSLIAKQELSLINEIANSQDIEKTEFYCEHAQKLNMGQPEFRLSQQQHQTVCFKTFCNHYDFEKHLDTWVQNSTHFREPLQQLIAEREHKEK